MLPFHTVCIDAYLYNFLHSLKGLDARMTKHQMISFDVTSLFTKVPLAYTIKLILDRLYGVGDSCQDEENKKMRENWCITCQNRADLKQLLEIATSDTHFSFNGKYYKQHNGVAMSSPLVPIIAHIFMIDLERKLMKKLRKKGVLWYKRFVDDTFVIIRKKAGSDKLLNILNSYHPDIQFTLAKEENQ